jgi:hypothetical protein
MSQVPYSWRLTEPIKTRQTQGVGRFGDSFRDGDHRADGFRFQPTVTRQPPLHPARVLNHKTVILIPLLLRERVRLAYEFEVVKATNRRVAIDNCHCPSVAYRHKYILPRIRLVRACNPSQR